MDNRVGRELPKMVDFGKIGFVMCDGVVIENVKNCLVSLCEDEIVLRDKNNYGVGIIYGLSQRKDCFFADYKDDERKDVILNGEVVI